MRDEGRRARRWLAYALLPVILLIAAPAARAEERLSGVAGLSPFFRALLDVERHRVRRPLRILQIGDSHTANDSFSGRLRERLQARFGAAGRGWLPAGVPFKYYRPALVTVSETGWRHLRPDDADAGDWLGIDAVSARADAPGSRMMVNSDEPQGFDRVAVEFVAAPEGAPLLLRIDNGAPLSIPTTGRHIAIGRFEKLLPRGAYRAELTAGAAGQEILGWAVERHAAGIVYENHGTIGATVALLAKLNPATVEFELKDRRPALLVVAFGTNEGFNEALDLAQYPARFRAAVMVLHRAAPGAAVLILGPPDGNRQPKDCAGSPPDCGGGSSDAGSACGWSEPRHLAAVRDIQRQVAAQQGWAFWDWSAAMGGVCSMHRWFAQEPPLAMPDHVHLNKAGYAAAADMLFADLIAEYDKHKRGR